MSDSGAPDPAIAKLPAKLQQIICFASAFSRPFMTYSATITVCIGIFRVGTVDALWVGAAMAGVYGVARSFDKRAPGFKDGV